MMATTDVLEEILRNLDEKKAGMVRTSIQDNISRSNSKALAKGFGIAIAGIGIITSFSSLSDPEMLKVPLILSVGIGSLIAWGLPKLVDNPQRPSLEVRDATRKEREKELTALDTKRAEINRYLDGKGESKIINDAIRFNLSPDEIVDFEHLLQSSKVSFELAMVSLHDGTMKRTLDSVKSYWIARDNGDTDNVVLIEKHLSDINGLAMYEAYHRDERIAQEEKRKSELAAIMAENNRLTEDARASLRNNAWSPPDFAQEYSTDEIASDSPSFYSGTNFFDSQQGYSSTDSMHGEQGDGPSAYNAYNQGVVDQFYGMPYDKYVESQEAAQRLASTVVNIPVEFFDGMQPADIILPPDRPADMGETGQRRLH